MPICVDTKCKCTFNNGNSSEFEVAAGIAPRPTSMMLLTTLRFANVQQSKSAKMTQVENVIFLKKDSKVQQPIKSMTLDKKCVLNVASNNAWVCHSKLQDHR